MNLIIKNSNVIPSDKETLFGDEEVVFIKEQMDMSQLMVKLGIYKSSSKARHAGRTGDIPIGWTEYKASKKVTLFIWNPTE